jgi:methylmalonyl-CoA/ethylmalonyl-CoA epimerase
MTATLHHAGFVVASIAATAASMAQQLGFEWDGEVIHDPLQKVRVTFLKNPMAGESQVELVEPADPKSPVTRFLEEHGGGLQHLCYEVDNLEAELKRVRGSGAVIAKRPQPAVAFGGRRIAWVLTKERLLVEYLERTLSVVSSEVR